VIKIVTQTFRKLVPLKTNKNDMRTKLNYNEMKPGNIKIGEFKIVLNISSI